MILCSVNTISDTTGHALGPAPGPPTPVPILPRNRSTMDKVCHH